LDAATVRDGLGRVAGWVPVDDLGPEGLAEVVRLGALLEGRVAGLRLHTVAAAEAAGAVAETAAADAAAWAAKAGKNRSRSWGHVWLARRLEESYPVTRAALAAGRISEDHAAVIVRAADAIPTPVRDALSVGDLVGCEEQLVAKAERMSPGHLRRAARRFLDPLSQRFADQHEEALLVAQEQRAEQETWLTLGDNGDGTWTLKGMLPDLHGALLTKALDVLGSPRRRQVPDPDRPGRLKDLDPTLPHRGYPETLGLAFCELLEHLPETGFARTGIQLIVHLDEDQLTNRLTNRLTDRVGDRVGGCRTDTGTTLSTAETRRLACEAGHLPFVLRGKSVPLDLGTSQRLFSKAQTIALSAFYDTCAADGCDRPFAWTEIHHLRPWSDGGPTDLDNAIPLCGHHHRRIHDQHYVHHRQPDGTITFQIRRRRRQVAPARAA
jgi:hypothetical protein